MKRGAQGVSMGSIEQSKVAKNRRDAARRRQERSWASRSGPVTSSTLTPEQLETLRGLQGEQRREFWERLRAAGAASQARSAESAAEGAEGPSGRRGGS